MLSLLSYSYSVVNNSLVLLVKYKLLEVVMQTSDAFEPMRFSQALQQMPSVSFSCSHLQRTRGAGFDSFKSLLAWLERERLATLTSTPISHSSWNDATKP
jgi:hypothetical protein